MIGLLDWPARRLTAAGRLVAVGTAFAAGFGVDTTLSAVYQVFALGVALLAVTLLATCRSRTRVELRRHASRLATVGEPFRYELELANRGAHAIEAASLREVLVADRTLAVPRPRGFAAARRWRRGGSIDEVRLPPLAPGASRRVAVEFTPTRRGVIEFAAAALLEPDALGLARAVTEAPCPGRIVVLPQRHPVKRLALAGAPRLQPGGVANAGKVGDVADFVGLRDYRPGDPPRRISWKSFARTGRPIVREHEEEHFVRHALVLDTFSADAALVDSAASVAASLAVTIDTTEALLDMLLVEDRAVRLTAGRGLGEVATLLEAIAVARARPAADFARLAAHVRAASGLIFVLLAWDAPRRELVEMLRAQGAMVAVFVVVAPGAVAPAGVYAVRADRVGEDLAALAAR